MVSTRSLRNLLRPPIKAFRWLRKAPWGLLETSHRREIVHLPARRSDRFTSVSGPSTEQETPRLPGTGRPTSLLRDGRTAHIRPIRPDDAQLLVEFYSRVSDESKYYRFFSPMPQLSDRDVARFTQVDHFDRVAFVLLCPARSSRSGGTT